MPNIVRTNGYRGRHIRRSHEGIVALACVFMILVIAAVIYAGVNAPSTIGQ